MTFRLHVINAEFGDCLLLEYGTAANPLYMLLDGGPTGVWAGHLEPTLRRLAISRLEAVVLTHVDTDHTTGLIAMLTALQGEADAGEPLSREIGGLWMNAFGDVLDEDGKLHSDLASLMGDAGAANIALAATGAMLAGVKDGNTIRTLAYQLEVPRNEQWQGKPILVSPTAFTMGNLKLTVVGPSRATLDALRAEWLAWLAKQRKRFNDNKPAFAAMADQSVPNLSSIQLLVEVGKKSLLLTGDGRGDHLLDGLARADRLDDGDGIDVDVLKLPHHGSDRNVTREFFRRVRARTYIVSANGKHGNPDLPTLQWIVEGAQEDGREIEIVATNRTTTLEQLMKILPPKKSGYKLRFRPSNRHSVAVELG